MNNQDMIVDAFQDCFSEAVCKVCLADSSANDFEILVKAVAGTLAERACASGYCRLPDDHGQLTRLFEQHVNDALSDTAANRANQFALFD